MNLKNIIQYTHDLSILYIEDDLDSREQISSILEGLFSVVKTADDGQLGIEAYNNYYSDNDKYYDLVLSDLELPNLNGIDLCKNILKVNPEQHIIIISAHNDQKRLQELIVLGIDNFLHKPIDYKHFFETFKNSSKPILDKKNILQKLQNTQELNYNLEAIMDIINQVAIVSKTDLEGNITYVNDIFCKTSKYTREELLGKNHNILRHHDMPTIVFQHMWEDIQNGKIWKGKIKNRDKYNSYHLINANLPITHCTLVNTLYPAPIVCVIPSLPFSHASKYNSTASHEFTQASQSIQRYCSNSGK